MRTWYIFLGWFETFSTFLIRIPSYWMKGKNKLILFRQKKFVWSLGIWQKLSFKLVIKFFNKNIFIFIDDLVPLFFWMSLWFNHYLWLMKGVLVCWCYPLLFTYNQNHLEAWVPHMVLLYLHVHLGDRWNQFSSCRLSWINPSKQSPQFVFWKKKCVWGAQAIALRNHFPA